MYKVRPPPAAGGVRARAPSEAASIRTSALVFHPSGNELKLVFPQEDAPPERFATLEFDHFFLQPMDGPRLKRNTELAVDYCKAHPRWRLSLQTHKIIGIP